MTARPWLAHYPPGMPTEPPPADDPSLVALFDRCCHRFADLPALENFGTILSYRRWQTLSCRFAAGLQSLGLKKGQRLAIMLPNFLSYPVALTGALRAGLVVVNVNPLLTPRELAVELGDARPDAIVVLEQLLPKLAELPQRPQRPIVVRAGDLLEPWKRPLADWLARWRGRRWPRWPQAAVSFRELLQTRGEPGPVPLAPEDLAFLQYTGGTTGTPKGAMLSHANLLANIEQVRLWLTCEGWRRPLRPGRERLVTALPLYHIFALTANLWVGLGIGSHNYLVPDPRNLRDLVRVLRHSRFTCITGVNTLFDHLLRAPGFERLDFSPLRLTVAGGMPMNPRVTERWQAVTGCPVVEGYGLTEASPVVSLNPLDLERYNGSIGLPLPGTDCCLRNDGASPPPGEPGELCVRGPQVMRGYWNRPEETTAVFTADGWLRTGDIARMDADGFFYIVDRKKDMILVSGFNVYPNEIETVVEAHPGVRECAAVGVPDPDTGEAVVLFVVREDPDLDERALRAWCRERLTAYKRPRRIEFREELPKSAIGKVLRRQLRESLNPPRV